MNTTQAEQALEPLMKQVNALLSHNSCNPLTEHQRAIAVEKARALDRLQQLEVELVEARQRVEILERLKAHYERQIVPF